MFGPHYGALRNFDTKVSSFLRPLVDMMGFPIDWSEDDAEYTVVADLAGVKKSDISISAESDTLYIKASRPCFEPKTENSFVWLERPCGDMERYIQLPRLDTSSIKATVEDGTLTIVAKKAASDRSKVTIS